MIVLYQLTEWAFLYAKNTSGKNGKTKNTKNTDNDNDNDNDNDIYTYINKKPELMF